MRSKALLIISLLGNLILGVALILNMRESRPARPVVIPQNVVQGQGVLTQKIIKATQVVKTNIIREKFTWQQIEAEDYPTYIANLRAIGCPEQTIKDIIIADVNHLYARKRISDRPVVNDQWWRSDPDFTTAETDARKLEALEREKRALLTQLLGPNWDTDETQEQSGSGGGLVFPGEILGKLSQKTKQELNASFQRMRQAYENHIAQRRALGQSEDPVEVARIRRQFRSEIETILTPEQLEEFLLRYSHISYQLRRQTQNLDITPQEFRLIFRALDNAEKQLGLSDFANNETAMQRRAAIEKMADETIKQVLGEDRFLQYKFGQDPVFNEAKVVAQNLGVSGDMVRSIYEINKIVQSEIRRISADTTLSEEQKLIELQNARQAQMTALRQLLGEELFKRWEQLYGKTQ